MQGLMNKLNKENRLMFEVELEPEQGTRFQPTGFPDIQAATYKDPSGRRMLLVESTQSMANRLEKTIIGANNVDIREEFSGLPYVIAELKGKFNNMPVRTSSLVEAHRIASPYILTKEFWDSLKKESNYSEYDFPDWKSIAKTIFKYDPNSLIHGVFISNEGGGRIRFQRILSSFIEAEDVEEVLSGGVKRNEISPTGEVVSDENKGKNIYGNVIYHRIEYTAKKITAYFNVDIATLRSYALGDLVEELLLEICLFKIREFLDNGLKLRTACNFKVKGEIKSSQGFEIPEKNALVESIKEGIKKCSELFSNPNPFKVSVNVKPKDKIDKNKEDKGDKEPSEENEEDNSD